MDDRQNQAAPCNKDHSISELGKNFVPTPYRRVGIREVNFPLTTQAIEKSWAGKKVYCKTDFLVLKNQSASAILEITEKRGSGLFQDIVNAKSLCESHETIYTIDPNIDTSSPFQMGKKYMQLDTEAKIKARALVVEGESGHVNFIVNPEVMPILVIDHAGPVSRLISLIGHISAFSKNPRYQFIASDINLSDKLKNSDFREVMLPCKVTGMHSGNKMTRFLDQVDPDIGTCELIGCPRSKEIFESIYEHPPQSFKNVCPVDIFAQDKEMKKNQFPVITRCCKYQEKYQIKGNQLVVPWGVDHDIMRMALEEFIKVLPN